jgi:hypothetical protein
MAAFFCAALLKRAILHERVSPPLVVMLSEA